MLAQRLVRAHTPLAAAGVLWWRWYRANEEDKPLWMVLYTTVSLSVLIGYSSLSYSYNLALLMPGVFVLVAAQDRLAAPRGLARAQRLTMCVGYDADVRASRQLVRGWSHQPHRDQRRTEMREESHRRAAKRQRRREGGHWWP